MIRHIVLTKFNADTTEEKIAAIYAELAALVEKLSGAHGFTGGRSSSPEQIERGYKHGFVIDFIDLHVNSFYWPVFNLADSFIFVGVALIIFERKSNSK